MLEEQTIFATSDAEAGLGRLEPLHVAIAGGEEAAGAAENIESGLTVDTVKICAGF